MISMKVKRRVYFDPTKALYKVCEQVVKDTSIHLEGRARHHAPKDTGFLKASIKKLVKRLRARVYTFAHYAGFVEYGTIYQRAQPYFRRAINDTLRILPTIISRAVRQWFK